ncbi:response regulator [Halpernia sp. GG3]
MKYFINSLEQKKIVPDIVLMDVNMPLKNGIETTQYLKNNYPEIKVIALTMTDDRENNYLYDKSWCKGIFT